MVGVAAGPLPDGPRMGVTTTGAGVAVMTKLPLGAATLNPSTAKYNTESGAWTVKSLGEACGKDVCTTPPPAATLRLAALSDSPVMLTVYETPCETATAYRLAAPAATASATGTESV